VAERKRQGVSDVGRGRLLGHVQQNLHHSLHLVLTGVAPSCDRLLHLVRAVLDYGDAGLGRGGKGQAAGLADRHSGPGVGLEEHTFDDNDLRRKPRKKQPELPQQLGQTLCYRV
jgi:hypothetical protein